MEPTSEVIGLLARSIDEALSRTVPREAYSAEETAKLLGVSRRTIEGLIDSNQIRVVRIGRHLRIDRREIDRFLGRK